MAIKGDSVQGYRHRAAGGGTVQRLMSQRTRVIAPCGKRVNLIHLAVNPIKDILARLREGTAADWEILPAIGDAWVDHCGLWTPPGALLGARIFSDQGLSFISLGPLVRGPAR